MEAITRLVFIEHPHLATRVLYAEISSEDLNGSGFGGSYWMRVEQIRCESEEAKEIIRKAGK